MTELTRRNLLKSVSLTLGGATLADLFRARAEAKSDQARSTATIFVTMGGGASQFETFDPKTQAPVEYRGEFQAISTALPGVQFCELLPKLAAMADRVAVVRSIHHEQASHIAEHIVETGYDLVSSANTRNGDMPSMGSVISRIRGVGASGIPGYVSIPRHHGYSSPHWLGAQHHFFAVDSDPNQEPFAISNLALSEKLNVDRLKDRRGLQSAFNQSRQVLDRSGDAAAIDQFSQQAFDLITGDRARRAFDIQTEDPRIRDRYGRNTFGQRLLLARRLVEVDVPFVTVRMGDWDDHDDLASRMKLRAPMFDTALTALIEDLGSRGMQRNVLVVAMGEFGRTPRVNAKGGRDHFPAVNSVLLSGGAYQMGQVIGATDRIAAQVTHTPYRPQNVLAMVYRHLGIDPATTFNDYSGRPRHVLEERGVITELG
jgi:hypothetical protein